MQYYVSKKNMQKKGSGTCDDPFSTIQQAAEIARAGDRVIISGGIYREWVNPRYGGISEQQRITYLAAPDETPVISGAEEVTGWERTPQGLWKKVVENHIFGDYNPFADLIYGDWYDDLGIKHHTGEVYMNGISMYEGSSVEALLEPVLPERSLCWYAEVSDENTVIWCNFQNADPNANLIEINVRPFCFFPGGEGINYITVSGLWVRQVATQWAPPTAFQTGAMGTHWSKGWVIENCTVSHSKCCGISIGKRRDAFDNAWSANPEKGGAQTYTETVFRNLKRDWSKDMIGSHIIRNNHIYQCGQAGIIGNMGCAFSIIERNNIHDINIRQEFEGAEIAGIKLHAAIDTLITGNSFHDCNRGLWLDWQAQGTRVTQNIFFENAWQDMFIEVCHGPCLIDHNLFLSKTNLRNLSQGSALVHNLFAGKLKVHRDTSRFSLYHLPHDTFVAGVMLIYGGDDRVANNIFLGQGAEEGMYGTCVYDAYPDIAEEKSLQTDDRPLAYADSMLPVDIHDNLYLNGARPYRCGRNEEEKCVSVQWAVHKRNGSYEFETNLFDCGWGKTAEMISSDTLGFAFESMARYENADGSDLFVNKDLTGRLRDKDKVRVGPFEKRFSTLQLTPHS